MFVLLLIKLEDVVLDLIRTSCAMQIGMIIGGLLGPLLWRYHMLESTVS